MDPKKQEMKFITTSHVIEDVYDFEILNSHVNTDSMFENALPSLKLNTDVIVSNLSPK